MYDFDQTTKITPTAQVVKLFDPNGKQVDDDLTPTLEATGIYSVTSQIGTEAMEGTWSVDWTITYANIDSREIFEFEVEE